MTPILFLDFDGVLNHIGTKERLDDGCVGLDPVNVAHLNGICRAVPTARIVVSSSWRLFFDLPELRDILGHAGFLYPDRVIDCTPQWAERHGSIVGVHGTRGDEIQAWFDAPTTEPTVIAILDDCEDMAHLNGRLVKTDMYGGGLTGEHATAVVRLLTESP